MSRAAEMAELVREAVNQETGELRLDPIKAAALIRWLMHVELTIISYDLLVKKMRAEKGFEQLFDSREGR